jgi:hypothetical protein
MHTKSLFFITIIFCSLILSCKKDHKEQPAEPVYIQFNPEGLAYVQLPLNKYYIFKDSATGTLDSVVVRQSNLEEKYVPASTYQTPFGTGHTPPYFYQELSLQLTSFNGTFQETWFNGTATNGEIYQNSDTIALSLYETDSIFLGATFIYPASRFSSPQENVDIIPEIAIEGVVYSNVIFYSNSNMLDSTDKDFIRGTYLWAKNIGIIKREIKTPGTVKTEFLVRHS